VWREGRLQVLDVHPPERRQDVAVAVCDSDAIKRQTD
jgi:hypothetical protein